LIIAVWGSSGSGKSTLAVKIALAISKERSNVILIDSNFVVPQAGIWFPSLSTARHESLSSILQNEITLEILASKIHLVGGPYLGVLGYAKGELSMNSILQRYDTAAVLLNTASAIADYVILDCQTNITQDYLTFAALEMAGCKLIVCTPDLRGVSFWMSNTPMLADGKYRLGDAVRIFNKVRDISPVNSVEHQVGSFRYAFPYDIGIEEEFLGGTIGNASGGWTSKRFNTALDALVSEIRRYKAG
jgi:MinD-like ATPase involved in chromosome partitioning or flagellar assembly